MAIVSGSKRVGRAEASVRVADPLVVQTTLPRFLSAGDTFQIPVFVTNLSGGSRDISVSLGAETLKMPGLEDSGAGGPPVDRVGGSAPKHLSLKQGEAGTVVFQAKAVRQTGAARIEVVARAGALESRESADVPLIASGPRTRQVEQIKLAAGARDLAPYLKGWVPTSERSTFWVTENPYGDVFEHLKYLIQYPYGCIEQTSSSTRPLLYVSNLLSHVDPTLVADGKIDDMVMHGVDRLLSMQTPSGGFAYWPGGTDPVDWGTAAVIHLLLDAKKRGYPVPQERIDDAVRYVDSRLRVREGAPHEEEFRGEYGDPEAYMQLVLAMAGKAHKARIETLLRQQPKTVTEERAEHRYMLQAALYLAGDRRYEQELRHPDLSKVTDVRNNGWTFYSDRRRRGFELALFDDLFGNDAAGEPLANLVAEALRGHGSSWYNTQEIVWGVTGLGKRLGTGAKSFGDIKLVANGTTVAPAPLLQGPKTADITWSLNRASELKTLGLSVGRKEAGDLYLLLNSEGVRQGGSYRVGGEGLSLKRTFRSQDGTELPLRGGAIKLGDVVFAQLTLTNASPERVGNISLVDRFPAGWEIENPRLGRSGTANWINEDAQWKADYLDLRDDRLVAFGGLERGESKQVVYTLRAVTAGHFVQPPAEAEAMYDPRIWAREGGGWVDVSGPWAPYLSER